MEDLTPKKVRADADYSQETVPEAGRKGFWPMFFIMLGFTFFSASMSVGAKMGNGMDLRGFVGAVLLGGAILGIYTGVFAYLGAKTGMGLDLLARHSFGRRGSWVPSAMIALTQIGWFGVGAAMFGYPAAEVLHVPPPALIVAAGVCMTSSAYFGIKGLEIVSYVSVPLVAFLGTYSMCAAAHAGGGLAAIFAQNAGTIGLFQGVGMVVGSFVSGGTTAPNFTRFARGRWHAVVTTVVAFFLGNSLMFAFGAVGGAFTGKDDIFYVMIAQGLMVPALLVLGANIWTTNDNALYSSGLGLANICRTRKRPMVLVAGIVGTAAAAWLYHNFVGWLSFLNATLPSAGAIVILDCFLNRRHYRDERDAVVDVNWGSVMGVAGGALAGNFIPAGIASLNAMAVACACYLALGGWRWPRAAAADRSP